MTLELPEGMHPMQFMAMGEEEGLAFILRRNYPQGIQKVGTLCGRFDVYRDIGGKNFDILPPENVTKDPFEGRLKIYHDPEPEKGFLVSQKEDIIP